MKIKVTDLPYEQVITLPRAKHKNPKKPSLFFRTLMKTLSEGDIAKTSFTCEKIGMEKLKKGEPYLLFMNHSSWLDLEIVSHLLYPQPYNIVCTSDGFVGKEGLMRNLGCIPTQKFVTDLQLIRDIRCSLQTLKIPVLMYPEASYTFDGRPTTLPKTLGGFLKMMKVPLVMIETHGSFSFDPLYNCLQKRKVKVSAEMKYLLSPEEIEEKSKEELNAILEKAFDFDGFRWQQENRVKIDEPFRADGLNRILYQCPHCGTEGKMEGKGVTLTCRECGKSYVLTEYGKLLATDGEGKFDHVPDWYAWEREQVKKQIEEGTYLLDTEVDICMMVDYKSIYRVGEGRLRHDRNGFSLTGCGGELEYTQSPLASYGLYADYFWYEIGDVICIGDRDKLFYCFPKNAGDVVAKTRIAAEEMYGLFRARNDTN